MASSASQNFVPIKEIRDGLIIRKDGTLVSVVMVSSVNFALKNNDEQLAILSQFQNFLNTFDFTVQIYVQSRRLNIKPYLNLLAEQEKAQTNDLLQIQTREYINFIDEFTANVNVMSKSFFVIVPYSPAILSVNKGGGPLGALFGGSKKKNESESDKTDSYRAHEENMTQMNQRVSIVQQGLASCGLRSAPLGTEELVELAHDLFNPDDNRT